MGQKERGVGHVTYFSNFGTPTSLERLKLQTSNFECGLGVRDPKHKMQN